MKDLPRTHPGVPDIRTPRRYLVWVLAVQKPATSAAIAAGVVWMVAQSVMPAIIGKAIDQGVARRDDDRLLHWALILFLAGVVQAVGGVVRHRFSVGMWLEASFRTIQLVSAKSTQLGATLPKRMATGEVVSVGANDIAQIGNATDVIGRAAGSIVAFLVVAGILLEASVTLGLVVLLGLPLLLLAIGPLLKPLQRRTMHQREMQGELNTLASDIVGGLRVLRGIGGEETFHARYARESQRVRRAGVEVGRLQSLLDALQVFLPGLFVVVVVWLGAHFAIEGRISVGELVAFYGYASFLVLPLRTATEFANKIIRAEVAAGRIIAILALQPESTDPAEPADEPTASTLHDPHSGLTIASGRLTAVVSEDPDESARIADRLGRYLPGEVTLGGTPLDRLPHDVVRRRVMVQDTAATLFSGELRTEVAPRASTGSDQILAALDAASALDVLDGLPDGLDSPVEERGRSFSGGQRQRLLLTRSLLAEPDVLVLVEPTSAVDAHTEARIAARLREARAGRTTVLMTASPLLLDQVDEVAFVAEGRVLAHGHHHDLLIEQPRYRRAVTREED